MMSSAASNNPSTHHGQIQNQDLIVNQQSSLHAIERRIDPPSSNVHTPGMDRMLESHERLSLGYIDSAAPLNMELPQTGMNEDIKHLQNRIRDLEMKIKQDNQEMN